MALSPLPHRINQAAWAVEWPLSPAFGEGKPLPVGTYPTSLGWAWHGAYSVMAAIGGEGKAVPLDQAHRFLDQLEDWTQRHRALLTWPATVLSFAQALRSSVSQHDAGAVAVLLAYPDYCRQVMAAAHALDPSIPQADALFQASAPPPVPARERAEPAAPRRAAPERIELPPHPPAFLVEWSAQVRAATEPAIARNHLDQNLKSALSEYPGSAWQWFQRELFPGLATLPADDLERLVKAWPPHNRFTPPDPVELVDSAWFWVILREAGTERREALSNGGLAALLDLGELSPATRLAMATKMLPFVAKKPSAFRQRLLLWQSLGGNLDAPAPEGELEEEPSRTVRQWIASRENEEWNAVMAGFSAPAGESRFRRGPAG